MKVVEHINTSSKTPLTESEKQHMKLVQETIDKNDYKPFPSKEEIIRDAVDLTLRNKFK